MANERYRKHWSDEEEASFFQDWQDDVMTDNQLAKKYGRPFKTLAKRAVEAGYRERCYYQDGLTADYICEALGIDRQTLITVWIKHRGLSAKQTKKGRRQYVVKEQDLLAFLEANQGLYDASLFADDAFISEPGWLTEKRKHDREFFPKNDKKDWTQNEEHILERLFFQGVSDAEIAQRLRRSEERVKERRGLLHLTRDRWNKKELVFLEENCRYMTMDEIAQKLPLRNAKSIALKCGKMGLPYHWSKNCCEVRE